MKFLTLSILLVCLAVASASPRIVGGNTAPVGKYPYQVSIRVYGRHYCGGSIINKRWILTAAHCVAYLSPLEKKTMKILVGTNSLSQTSNTTRLYSVKGAIPHELFDEIQLRNDVGLIKLSKSIKFNENVKPITLASEDYYVSKSKAVLTGWGDLEADGDGVDLLQEINLTVIDNEKCIEEVEFLDVADTQICTYNQFGQGSCNGDSGGPLVANGQQIGIVSGGIPCATGVPDIFTRVSSFRGWIEKKMIQHGY